MKKLLLLLGCLLAWSCPAPVYQNYYVTNATPGISTAGYAADGVWPGSNTFNQIYFSSLLAGTAYFAHTNQYATFDENGKIVGTNNGAYWTNIPLAGINADVAIKSDATNAAATYANGLSPNTIFVSGTGDDTTGNGSSGKPFASLSRGQTEATNGQTVAVMTGNYSSETLGKNGVAWYYADGVTCSNVLFSLTTTVTNISVGGRGTFQSGAFGLVSFYLLTNATAKLSVKSFTGGTGQVLGIYYNASESCVCEVQADYYAGSITLASCITNRTIIRTTGDLLFNLVSTTSIPSQSTNNIIDLWPGETAKQSVAAGNYANATIKVHGGNFDRQNFKLKPTLGGWMNWQFRDTIADNTTTAFVTNVPNATIAGTWTITNP